MPEIEGGTVSVDDEAPRVPPDVLPVEDDLEPVEEDPEEEEYDEEAEEAGLRVISAPNPDFEDDEEEQASLYEAPGARTRVYEDERTENEREKLDIFISKIRQTAGAHGKIDVERIGPRSLPEEQKGFLDRVNVEELEEVNVPAWLKDNWGGGEYRLAVRDSMSRFRAWVTVKVAGKAKAVDGDTTEDGGMIGLVKELLTRVEGKKDGGGGDVVRMMEMRMAEEREARKDENARLERESKERIEQMRIDSAAQLQMFTSMMNSQKPANDPLELAIRLSENSTKGYQESIKFQQKAMTEAMTSAITTSGDMHSSMVKHVLTTLRSVHDSEADQSFLDKVMTVAGTLAGPATEALKSMRGQEISIPQPSPKPAAPQPPGAVTPPPRPTLLPPPGPGGALPRAADVPATEAEPEGGMTEDQAKILQEQAVASVMITLERTAVFVQALGIQLTTDPDPEQAWVEIEPYYRALPGRLRDRVEEATADIPQSDSLDELLPFGEKLLDVFSELCGEPQEGEPQPFTTLRQQIDMIKYAVLADTNRAGWLRDFFDVAPWLEDEEDSEGDEDDEDDEDPVAVTDPPPAETPTIAAKVKEGESTQPEK